MRTLGCLLTVICVTGAGLGSSPGAMASGSAEANPEASLACANFRCRFGDVPKADPPLIAEPFVSFYRDQVVKPMRPYHDWEPTARQLPVSRSPRVDLTDETARRVPESD